MAPKAIVTVARATSVLMDLRYELYPVMTGWGVREQLIVSYSARVARILSKRGVMVRLRRLLELYQIGKVIGTGILHCYQDYFVPMDRKCRAYIEHLELVPGFDAHGFDPTVRAGLKEYKAVCRAVNAYVAASGHLQSVRDFVREAWEWVDS